MCAALAFSSIVLFTFDWTGYEELTGTDSFLELTLSPSYGFEMPDNDHAVMATGENEDHGRDHDESSGYEEFDRALRHFCAFYHNSM